MKRNTFVTACALGALLAAGPALAQTGGAGQPSTTQETIQPLPTAPEGQGGQSAQQGGAATQTEPMQSQPMQAETVEPTGTTQMQTAGTGPEIQGGFIVRQGANELLGSELMDAEVVTSADESLGSVEDLLIDSEGRILGVIVGIGGFLGIGQRQVAIPTESLQVMFEGEVAASGDAAGQTQPMPASGGALATTGGVDIERIVVDFTREQLEAAPEFARLDEEPREGQAGTEIENEVTVPVDATGSTPSGQTVVPPAGGTTDGQPRQ